MSKFRIIIGSGPGAAIVCRNLQKKFTITAVGEYLYINLKHNQALPISEIDNKYD